MEDIMEYKPSPGTQIVNAAAEALAMAMKHKKPVYFNFNDTSVIVQPSDSRDAVVERWQTDFDAACKAYREHPDRIKEKEALAEEERKERAVVMVETASSEKELREAKVPWPKTEVQLSDYVRSLIDKDHDYGTCVYAMSMAAVAAFNYVAGTLGVTGFQSSCADLDFLRRSRQIDGPLILIKGEDALYPQYDLQKRLSEAMEEWKPWLKEQAQKKLSTAGSAHPDVEAHWRKLAE